MEFNINMRKLLSLSVILNLGCYCVSASSSDIENPKDTQKYFYETQATEYMQVFSPIPESRLPSEKVLDQFQKAFPRLPKQEKLYVFSAKNLIQKLPLTCESRNHFMWLLEHGDSQDMWQEIDKVIDDDKCVEFDEFSWEDCWLWISNYDSSLRKFFQSILLPSEESSVFKEFVRGLLKTGATMPVYRDLVVALCARVQIIENQSSIEDKSVMFSCFSCNYSNSCNVYMDFIHQNFDQVLSSSFSKYISTRFVPFIDSFFGEIRNMLFVSVSQFTSDFDYAIWPCINDLFDLKLDDDNQKASISLFGRLPYNNGNTNPWYINQSSYLLSQPNFSHVEKEVLDDVIHAHSFWFDDKSELWRILGLNSLGNNLLINTLSALYTSLCSGREIKVNCRDGVLEYFDFDYHYYRDQMLTQNIAMDKAFLHTAALVPERWKAFLMLFGVTPEAYQENIDNNDVWKHMWIFPVKSLGYALKYQNWMGNTELTLQKNLSKKEKRKKQKAIENK